MWPIFQKPFKKILRINGQHFDMNTKPTSRLIFKY